MMEQWEIDLRAQLQEDLPDGIYDLGVPGFKCYTGKGGYIEYKVSMHKEMKKYVADMTSQLPPKYILDEEHIKENIRKLFHTN